MPGEPDPQYVLARRALLDALEALEPHLDALVLVGAQAVYLHTGATDLAVAEYTVDADLIVAALSHTTDADLAIGPTSVADAPLLGDLLASGGFTPRDQPGGWRSADGVYLDVMVPETLAGPGRRGARLGPHGNRVARRARGLEAALIDLERRSISSFEQDDARVFEIWMAGPAALLVAKVHKIAERVGASDRVVDKDALDLLRLLQAVPTEEMTRRLAVLKDSDLAGDVTREALSALARLFASPTSDGSQMAARAVSDIEDPEIIAASAATLSIQLIDGLKGLD